MILSAEELRQATSEYAAKVKREAVEAPPLTDDAADLFPEEQIEEDDE